MSAVRKGPRRGAESNYRRGIRYENAYAAHLRARGWHVTSSKMSRGAFDHVAYNQADTLFIAASMRRVTCVRARRYVVTLRLVEAVRGTVRYVHPTTERTYCEHDG